MKRAVGFIGFTLAVTILLGFGAGPAAATTFCVPAFHPACPDTPTSQAEADLQTAMATLGNDGIPDKVIIDEGTLSHPGSIFPQPFDYAEDPLEVVGAGVDRTRITATGNNIYVMDLSNGNFRQRKVTMRDLTLVAPAGASDSLLQTVDDVFERVDFESQDQTGAKPIHALDGGVFRDVRIFGTGGGRFSTALETGAAAPGSKLEITDADVSDSGSGVNSTTSSDMPVTIKSSHFKIDGQVLSASDGDQALIENSIIEAGQYTPLYVETSTSDSSTLTLRNNTILNQGGAERAISSKVSPGASGSATAVVSDSIIFGFDKTWTLEAPVSAADGDANLDLSYSNISSSGTTDGDGSLSAAEGVISETPLFESFSDFHLTGDSPSIDAGNPSPGGLLTDINGTIRPLDGNLDGTAVRDQGAYEFIPVIPDPTDKVKPKISKVRFKAPKGKKKSVLRLKLSEKARVTATFKKKRKLFKLVKSGKKGLNTFKVKRGKLKPGKYRLTIFARDPAGNKSKPVVRKVKVKKAGSSI